MQTEKIIAHIVNWLKNYAENAKMNGFAVGVSGGIDSAVVSTLAAMTGMKTLVLEMPIRQKIDQTNRAQEHISNLKAKLPNVEGFSVDLTPVFDTFQKTVKADGKTYLSENLAFANTRSRMRMLTLYFHAQVRGLLVTGTGNKVEDFGVGFYTKYGDGGVDISPIADLMKSEVYEIAKTLGIAESIQQATPTDGLWDADKTDEQQMGATYPELEWAMNAAETHNPEDFTGRQREVMEIFLKLNRTAQHKMQPIPVCEIPKELK